MGSKISMICDVYVCVQSWGITRWVEEWGCEGKNIYIYLSVRKNAKRARMTRRMKTVAACFEKVKTRGHDDTRRQEIIGDSWHGARTVSGACLYPV